MLFEARAVSVPISPNIIFITKPGTGKMAGRFITDANVLVNSLFVLKYGARIEQVSVLFILFGNNTLILGSLFLFKQKKDWINNLRHFDKLYIVLAFILSHILAGGIPS